MKEVAIVEVELNEWLAVTGAAIAHFFFPLLLSTRSHKAVCVRASRARVGVSSTSNLPAGLAMGAIP